MSPRPPPGLQRRPVALEPQCTHLHMTRLYDPQARCCACHRLGRFGWLYQCTQDQENFIEHAVSSTGLEVFDLLGQSLCGQLSVRERSPAAREDKFSFLKEITPEQMASYSPEQIATILRQRENVQITIQKERLRKSSAAILGRLDQANGTFDFSKPWLTHANEICEYLVCPNCRPAAADRAYLSLNAVAKGEMLPTAAAGYGFHIQGERPVVNTEILRTIGCRSMTSSRRRSSSENTSSPSDLSIMERLSDHIAREHDRWTLFPGQHNQATDERRGSQPTWPLTPTAHDSTLGQLKHSPKCHNLAVFSEHLESLPLRTAQDQLSWTPPPSPSHSGSEGDFCAGIEQDIAERSLTPAITGLAPRDQPVTNGYTCHNLDHIEASRHGTPFRAPPIPPEPSHAVFLDEVAYQAACTTPIDPPDSAEERYLHGHMPPTSESTESHDDFAPAPLKVGHGVAMMEESVELEIPDVITQL